MAKIDSHKHASDYRKLPERSFLKFYYTESPDIGGATIVTLPFSENIQVVESKKARYTTYSPFNRSSDMYAYTGAGSRQLKITFAMSLPHILDLHPGQGVAATKETTTEEKKKAFDTPQPTKTKNLGTVTAFAGSQFLDNEYRNMTTIGPKGATSRTKIIDIITYWINIIRTSVSNKATDPSWGPPIVRLTHGILYQDVPCIVKNYNIQVDDKQGYDQSTLLPRRIQVILNMEEVRVGDLGKYSPASLAGGPFTRDNLAGWEAVLEHGTADPLPMMGNSGSQVIADIDAETEVVSDFLAATSGVPPVGSFGGF